MSISSLPLEIFSDIIDHVVTSFVQIRDSAHLRLVNRTFDLEIRRSYARTSRFESDRTFAVAAHSPSKCAFFAKYLLLRPHGKGKAEKADISFFLNDLVDQLLIQEKNEDESTANGKYDDAIRYQLLSILCAKTNKVHITPYPSPVKLVEGSTSAMELLIAAIYTEQQSLVNQLLNSGQINFQTDTSTFFETPLLAAVQTQNAETVRALLAHNALFSPPQLRMIEYYRPNPVLAAARNNDLPILTMLLESPNLCKTGQSYEYAIIRSITSSPDSRPTKDLLLSHYSSPISSSPYLLEKGLQAACHAGNTELITFLIDSGADVNATMDFRGRYCVAAPIAQAAWKGQVETIHLLLSRGATFQPKPGANTGVRTQHPGADSLRAATWGNHWLAARVLLDAGAAQYLTRSDWCSVFKIAALHAECVDVAAQLLDCGVVKLDGLADDEISAEDAVAELVAIVCAGGNEGLMDALVKHGLPVGEHPMYQRGEYPVPIVQALAWGQQGVVGLLERRTGQKVDGEMRRLAEEYREREDARSWSRVEVPKCGMPMYTILR